MMKRARSCDLSQYRHGCDPPDRMGIVSPQADASIQNADPSRHLSTSITQIVQTAFTLLAVYTLMNGLTGCGAPPADPPNLESRRGSGKPEDRLTPTPLFSTKAKDDHSQSVNETRPNGTSVGGDDATASLLLGIPATVINDLNSSDARVRYQALEHWSATDSNAPLDPVFEAMEDEDEGVRAKATAIVEQYWATKEDSEEEEERS